MGYLADGKPLIVQFQHRRLQLVSLAGPPFGSFGTPTAAIQSLVQRLTVTLRLNLLGLIGLNNTDSKSLSNITGPFLLNDLWLSLYNFSAGMNPPDYICEPPVTT